MTFLDRLGELLFWPLVLMEKREERRMAECRAASDRWVAHDRAHRSYMAAASQAAQARQGDRERMLSMAVRSLEKGDRAMLDAGLRPEGHRRRAAALKWIEQATQPAVANDNASKAGEPR